MNSICQHRKTFEQKRNSFEQNRNGILAEKSLSSPLSQDMVLRAEQNALAPWKPLETDFSSALLENLLTTSGSLPSLKYSCWF